MARSKIGGAFGMLRGSIGSVTYSTKKTSSGKTEQIARQKAQSVTNPNTTAQILQRMKLGPAQRFYDAFENVVAKGIISHAFESVTYGTASRQHFISLAMKKEDAVYVPKGVDFFVPGEYQVSEGSLSPISYFNQLTAQEAAQNNLIVNFNDEPLTAENVETFVDEGYEQGMQLTLIGARAIANGRYEPFATRILMQEGNGVDNPINLQLYDQGVVVVGDENIAAIAIIVSKGSQESNDYRSSQTMKFVNGYESLKSLDALQAAIESYQEGYEVNSLNSNWYLNQDNGQAFNGRVELMQQHLQNDYEVSTQDDVFCGIQVEGSNIKVIVFTDDGTANGKIFTASSVNPRMLVNFGGQTQYEGETVLYKWFGKDVQAVVTYAKLTAEIAAQGGFTLGA